MATFKSQASFLGLPQELRNQHLLFYHSRTGVHMRTQPRRQQHQTIRVSHKNATRSRISFRICGHQFDVSRQPYQLMSPRIPESFLGLPKQQEQRSIRLRKGRYYGNEGSYGTESSDTEEDSGMEDETEGFADTAEVDDMYNDDGIEDSDMEDGDMNDTIPKEILHGQVFVTNVFLFAPHHLKGLEALKWDKAEADESIPFIRQEYEGALVDDDEPIMQTLVPWA